MNSPEVLAYVACALLATLAVFQLALIMGAPIGKYAWGGAHVVLPTKLRIGSFISIILYGIIAMIVLSKAGATDIISSERMVNGGMWVLAVYFFVGVLMNSISRSNREKLVMTPVALALAIVCLLLALR